MESMLLFDILFSLALTVGGILFWLGIGADFALGQWKDRFEEKPSMRFFSMMLLAMAVCNWLVVLGRWQEMKALMYGGMIASVVVVVAGGAYFMKSSRFRK